MELSEVKQLTHKIIKINITNKNYHSSYSYITRQIVLSDVSDEEVVRFSLEENSNFIQHQCDDENKNIFYVVIPNKVNSTIALYAHYFPAELYEYEEDQNIYWSFDFQDLLKENPLNDTGHKYPIIETDESKGYRKEAGYKDGSIQLKSILPDSIDGYKNPNYKNFTKTNINDTKDMTEQGYTPLSSRYRKPYKYFNEAPSLNGDPQWNAEEAHGTICQETPYWEIRINRDGLSRLVADTVDGKYYPISVHLGYEYLPTSTHYHQHYYGFEGECPDPNDIYVFEGTNITDVNDGFGSKNNYRIIKRTEPFDDTYSMFVDHECILPIDLLQCKPEEYITQNKCYDYYTYTAIGNDIPGRSVNLQAGEQYSLRYFIFVPNDVDALIENDNNSRPKETITEEQAVFLNPDVSIYSNIDTEIEDGILQPTKTNSSNFRGFLNYPIINNDQWTLRFDATYYKFANAGGYSAIILKDANSDNLSSGIRINQNNGDVYGFDGSALQLLGNMGWARNNNIRQTYTIERVDATHFSIHTIETQNQQNERFQIFEYQYLPNITAFNIGIQHLNGNWFDTMAANAHYLKIFNPTVILYTYQYLVDELTSDCYLTINGQRIEDEFLEYDKQERNQWIYHEVPFIAKGDGMDWIEVVGPHNNPDIEFFLTKIEIEKFVEYRPTLTYNEHGLRIEEASFDNTCTNKRQEGSKGILRIPEVSEEDNKWEIRTATNVWEQKTQLPNPQGKVFFILGDDVSLDYDEVTGNLYYSHLDNNEYGIKYYPFYIDEEPPKIKIPDRLGNNIDDLIIAITKQYDFESENNPDYGMLEIDEYNYITIPDKYQKTGTYTVHIENYITGEEYDYNYKVKPKRIREDMEGFEEGDLGQSNVRDEDTNNKLYNLLYDISTGDLNFTYPRTVQFFKARNNHFELSLVDGYDNIITRGSTRVEFIKGRTTFEEALVDAGKRDVQKDGKVYYRKINLSDLELDKDENGNEIATIFHLRIYYTDPCYNEPIIDFKKVWVEPLNLDLRPSINGNYKNSRFISYTQDGTPVYGKDCEGYKQSEYYEDDDASKSDSNEDEEEQVQQRQIEYQNFETHTPLVDNDTHKSYYGGVWGNYPILDKTHFKGTRIVRGGYYIYDVEAEFPLDICVDVVNKFSSGELQPIPIGHYCELSIDDKVIQTTLSDAEGKAHFYIDLNDAPLRKHTIKIECFDRYWEPIKYIYFDLIICEDTTKIRPAVPIAFKHFPYCPGYVKTDDETQCEFTYLTDNNLNLYIPQDDTLLLDFDNSENHSNFKLSVYRHKPQYKNISKFTNRNSTLIYSQNIYNEQDLLLFISAGLNFDTNCKLERDGIEAQHPNTTSPSETTQIANLRDNIKLHGKTPSIDMLTYFNANERIITTNQATITISPEIMCDLMLYAPIVNLKELNNTTIADLFDFYRKNILDNPVRYSIITSSLDGEDRYRTHKRTFTVHYMNNIRANNYKMQWDGKDNDEPLYTLNEEGKWIFKSIEIKKTAPYNPNDIRSIDNDNEHIKEGKIEVYQNGQLYHYPPIVYDNGDYVCKVENIIKKEANEEIQLRYVFKDGYHFITDSED